MSFADFMDALSDPRAYLSAQEKRAEQLLKVGIEGSDINEKDIIMTKKKPGQKATASGMPSILGHPDKKEQERGDYN